MSTSTAKNETASSDWIADALAPLKPLVRLNEAAATLRMCTRSVSRMIADGRIRAIRPTERGSSRLLIPRAEIEKYLRSLEVRA